VVFVVAAPLLKYQLLPVVFAVAAPFLEYKLLPVVFVVAGVPPAANFTILLLTNILATDVFSL